MLKKTTHKENTVKESSVATTSTDTSKINTSIFSSVSDTAITVSTETGEYVITLEPKTIGDTVVVVPVKITGKYTNTTKRSEGKQQSTHAEQTEGKGQTETYFGKSKLDSSEQNKDVSRLNIPMFPIILIAILLFLLFQIFPPSFIKDKLFTLIRKLC